MIEHACPQEYSATKTVSDSTMSESDGGLGVPTLSISADGRHIGHFGQPRASLLEVFDLHEDMSTTEPDTHDRTATIDLADCGVAVPRGTTCEVTQVAPNVYRLERNGVTYEIEVAWRTGELTLRNKTRPERVPDWLEAAMQDAVGIDEVTL